MFGILITRHLRQEPFSSIIKIFDDCVPFVILYYIENYPFAGVWDAAAQRPVLTQPAVQPLGQ